MAAHDKTVPTAYGLLLQSLGLSIPEAARLHKVDESLVSAWITGAETAPPNALKFLYANIDLQAHAADWLLRYLRKHPVTERIKLCISDDRSETGTLGWPTASMMNGAVRRFLEMADDSLRHRTTIIFNPRTPEDRSGTYFLSVRLRKDGTFADPDDPEEPEEYPEEEH